MHVDQKYTQLVEGLKLLAASYEDQKKYLPEFVDVPHDVVDSMQWNFELLPEQIEAGKFTLRSVAMLIRTYNRMNLCDIKFGLEDFGSKEWNEVRDLAKLTLIEMNEPVEAPDMRWT